MPCLPYFAVPRYLEFMSELPTTENGKTTIETRNMHFYYGTFRAV